MDARRRTSSLRLGVGALICAALAACTSAPAERPLRLGTTFTVQQSGALALLDSLTPPDSLATVIAASGQILQSAARGDLGVALTHAPSLEERLLVAPGHVVERCPFVASRFAIVGPASDPAGITRATLAADALARIARAGATFISRGDSSGTNVKELALWRAAGVTPHGQRWYVEAGADQATTLHVTDERSGYALADLPTLARTPGLELRVLFDRDTALTNPYTLYVVRGPDSVRAAAFAAWAMTAWRNRLLQVKLPDGSAGFVKRSDECDVPSRVPSAKAAAPHHHRPAPQSPAAALFGTWQYHSGVARDTTRPSLNAGLQFALTFDSVAGRAAFGRVSRWFAGDVGALPGTFGRVVATVDSVGMATVVVPYARGNAELLQFVLELRFDTISILHGL